MKTLIRHLFLIVLIATIGSSCYKKNLSVNPNQKMTENQGFSNSITVLIHGTLLPGTVTLTRKFDFPLGFNLAKKQPDRLIHGRIPRILNQLDPENYSLENFYLYGWSGKLDFEERKKAATDLYQKIVNCKTPVTIIAHSHGCNVALNLAQVAQECGNKDFKIDRLILLGGPVQEATKNLTKSEVFKKIYLFYSSADVMQIIDPQGIYRQSTDNTKCSKIFSQRTFEESPNLIQTKILIYNQPAAHLDFLLEKFIKWLPFIVNLVETARSNNSENNNHFAVNIPKLGKQPYLVDQENNKYIPRSR